MSADPATVPSVTTRRISYDAFPASALMRAYVSGDVQITRYYTHNPWVQDGLAAAAQIAASRNAHRDLVADVLLDQNAQWWGDEEEAVREHIERLRDPKSAIVVTGQQLGLFGGPMYTVYKALTAVGLAKKMSADSGNPVIPVFWLADEDHDFAEVHATTLPNGADPIRVVYDDGLDPEANRGPVGHIRFGEAILESVDALFRAFPDAPEWIRDVWKPGELWRDAFAHTLRRLTAGTGLVFVSGDDQRLKRLAVPLFEREVNMWQETNRQLRDVSEKLESDGFHAQVQPAEVNLFLFEDGQRLPIDPDGDGFVLRGTDKRFSKQELLDIVTEQPEKLSPNVVLRPLMQDILFPTAAYVAGPGELAYFAQLKPIYEAFDVPMPAIYPRASITFISEKQQRQLDEYEIDIPDLAGDLPDLHKRLTLQRSDHDYGGIFADAKGKAEEIATSLEEAVTAADSSLDKALAASLTRMTKSLDRLEKKTIRVEKQNQQVILDRLERLAGELMPGGRPQERVMCALTAVERMSTVDLLDAIDLDVTTHQVATV